MTTRRHPHLPPVWLMALALVAVAANLRTAMASVPPLTETIADDLGLSNTALGALTTLPVLCMGLFAPTAQRIAAPARSRGLGRAVDRVRALGLGAAARRRRHLAPVCRDVRRRGRHRHRWHPPPRPGQGALPARARGAGDRPLHARDDGRGRRVVGAVSAAGGLAGVVAGLARLVVAAGRGGGAGLGAGAARARPAPGREPVGRARRPDCPGSTRRPGWSPATSRCSRSSSTPRWPGSRRPTTARGWDPTHAGYLLSVFTAAQLVSGLLAPALTDRIHDRRVLLLSASVLGLLGQAGLWLAPAARPGCGRRSSGSARARRSPWAWC